MKTYISTLVVTSFLLSACSLSPASPTATLPPSTSTASTVSIQVYFTNLPNFQVGQEPYETAVTRTVPAGSNLPEAVLQQLFAGPTADEKSQGLAVFLDGATGFSKLTIDSGVARVYLAGDCNSNGAAYTIANLVDVNLKQFPQVQWIKIYDPNGGTETPDGQSGSIPFCLEP